MSVSDETCPSVDKDCEYCFSNLENWVERRSLVFLAIDITFGTISSYGEIKGISWSLVAIWFGHQPKMFQNCVLLSENFFYFWDTGQAIQGSCMAYHNPCFH